MKEFFHSWVFKVLLALAVIMFAFMLRATVTMGASTVLERIVGTITAPFQSLSAGVSGSVTGFLDQFLRASEISEENERLREENRQLIEQMVAKVEELSPKTVETYRNRLYARLQEVLQNNTVDQQRVLTEAAIFAEKIAVAEETVRLGSHVHQFRQILSSSEPVGRKLDFLVQEFNREANTIGSKAQDLEVARIVVDLKAEIEKIREQIQNIE